jgi:adenosine kinase
MKILISGSLAYDRIMDFSGNFSSHLIPSKTGSISISFLVNGMLEKFGGTAGNIAYSLSLLNEQPLILSTMGRDYQRYFDWLKDNLISTEGIKIIDHEFTASAFITTDEADNQITLFNPGSMKYSANFKFNILDPENTIAIISPGNKDDMLNHAKVYRKLRIPYIFDPGQQIPSLDVEEFKDGVTGSKILIANDYEIELILLKLNCQLADLLELTELVITTKGGNGSLITSIEGDIHIPVAPPNEVLDPTGAGDAYRGGIIKGLIDGKNLNQIAQMGAVCAAYTVETTGTQEYKYTLEEYWHRYRQCFGEL